MKLGSIGYLGDVLTRQCFYFKRKLNVVKIYKVRKNVNFSEKRFSKVSLKVLILAKVVDKR